MMGRVTKIVSRTDGGRPELPEPWKSAYDHEVARINDLGQAAARFVRQYRGAHDYGPTFEELFVAILPESADSLTPAQLSRSERQRIVRAFRSELAHEMRLAHWIWYSTKRRSLDVFRCRRAP
jgi:hypothetical protein